jgi:hypothetical protein
MSDNVERPAPKFSKGQVVGTDVHGCFIKIGAVGFHISKEWAYTIAGDSGYYLESNLRSLTPEEMVSDLDRYRKLGVKLLGIAQGRRLCPDNIYQCKDCKAMRAVIAEAEAAFVVGE